MVHKLEEIKAKEIATQKDIDALKEQIKLWSSSNRSRSFRLRPTRRNSGLSTSS